MFAFLTRNFHLNSYLCLVNNLTYISSHLISRIIIRKSDFSSIHPPTKMLIWNTSILIFEFLSFSIICLAKGIRSVMLFLVLPTAILICSVITKGETRRSSFLLSRHLAYPRFPSYCAYFSLETLSATECQWVCYSTSMHRMSAKAKSQEVERIPI